MVGQNVFDIFVEDAPNSVRTNRPLLEAISDENNRCSNILCVSSIEKERDFIRNNFVVVQTKSGVYKHKIVFFNSMVDEKRDRADSGLQGSGSSFLCTLCYAERANAKSNVGSFSITRNLDDTSLIAENIRVNPENLKESEIKKMCKGVKNCPISMIQPIEKGLDATHCDINMGQFFKKNIVREVAGVTKWEETRDIKYLLKNAECSVDMHFKCQFGVNPELMMPGNYARTLFTSNPATVCSLVVNSERRDFLIELFKKFCSLRKVYRCNNPLRDYPSEVATYKINAVNFGIFLRDHFPYVEWSNYVHKLIEHVCFAGVRECPPWCSIVGATVTVHQFFCILHVQQLIEDPRGPGSIGMFSSEGNEAGNKLFRHCRKNLSSRNSSLNSLRDVLKLHWLYSSKYLYHLAEVEHKKYKCSLCCEKGHNRRNCPLLKETAN